MKWVGEAEEEFVSSQEQSSPSLAPAAPEQPEQTDNQGVTEEPAPLSQFDRLFGALFDPQPAFADIAARPRGWWAPLLILIVLSAIFLGAFSQRVGWEQVLRQQTESNEQFQQLPVERQEEILQQQLAIVPYFAYVGVVLNPTILALFIAGVMLFVFNVMLGNQIRFLQSFSLTCYALLPNAVKAVVILPVLFLKDPRDFDLQNPIASNLGVFLSPDTFPAWLISLGASLDVFNLWSLALLAVGFSAAGRRLAWGRALGWILAAWNLYLMAKVGWVWIFS